MHGADSDFAPILFWKTPTLVAEDVIPEQKVQTLTRHLPPSVQKFVFGEDETEDTTTPALTTTEQKEYTQEDLKKEYENRGTSITMYIVNSNTEQVEFLAQIFEAPLFRMLLMKGDDFFLESEGRYASMGIDRLANALGAGQRFGFPSLVFDGGTAITYTAVDQNGILLGGGISPGFTMRLEGMNSRTSALPQVDVTAVSKAVENALQQEQPLKIFGSNTNDAMIINMLSEVSNNARHVAKVWLEKVGTAEGGNEKRHIAFTGGAGMIMKQLLQDNDSTVIEGISNTGGTLEVKYVKNLIHFGITAAIKLAVLKGSKKVPPFTKDDRTTSSLDDTQNTTVIRPKKKASKVKKAVQKEPEEEPEKEQKLEKEPEKEPEEEPEKQQELEKEPEKEKSLLEELAITPTPKPKKKRERSSNATPKPKRRSKRERTPTSLAKKPFDPQSFIGHRVAKRFDGSLFFGHVKEYVSDSDEKPFWHIVYDDEDCEGIEKNELMRAIKLHKQNSEMDPLTKRVDV